MIARRNLATLLLSLFLAGCPARASLDDDGNDVVWLLPPGDGSVPVVLLLEDSDGSPLARRHAWTDWFLGQGVAVAQIRSAAARGRRDWHRASCSLRYAIDAREALDEAARSQPRIDTTRFAILGAGRGGTEALNSASYFGPATEPASALPAAVFALYPGCDGWCPIDYPAEGATRVHIFHGRQNPAGQGRDAYDRCRGQAGGSIAFHALGTAAGFDRRGFDPVAVAIARAIIWETLALTWQIDD